MSLQPYRRGVVELSWTTRAWVGVESFRVIVADILPILVRHWTRQRVRRWVDGLTFLTALEKESVRQWLRSKGF